jgi:NADPH:quinone reductase-like Zn-dependent oxidoreductase
VKAFIYHEYGSADLLRLSEVATPVPSDDEVLIKNRAVSINDWDWQLLLGIPFANRVMNGLVRPKKHRILGSDVAGRIESVGRNVKRLKPGDEVYGDLSGSWGGFAEYVCAREDWVATKPPGMTFEEAAAIPQAGMLAVQGLRDVGQLRPGQTLLINGAGGGAGTIGIQIARLLGVEATGVDHTEKLELMRSVGFDHVVDYTKQDFTESEGRYDLILDVKTNRTLFRYLRALRPGGMYVTAGGDTGKLFQIFIFGPLVSLFLKKRVRVVILRQNKDLAYLNKLFEAGEFKPVMDGRWRFDEIPAAMRYFGDGHQKGKVVITI